MQHTGNRWGTRLVILLPLAVVIGLLAWWLRSDGVNRAPSASEEETIVLTVEPGGIVRLAPSMVQANSGRVTLDNQVQVRHFLRRVYEDPMRRVASDEGQQGPRVRFVIQADERANPADVEAVRVMCVEAGFKDIEVRGAVQ